MLLGCSPIRAVNALTPTGTYTLAADLPYGDLPRQKADVYRPTSAPPAGGFPIAVFFYGGTWNSGDRADYKFLGEALASRGVLTYLADYRLYPEVRYPEFLRDNAAAVAYALKDAVARGGNPRRLFVIGHSAGGYDAAMLALDDRWLKAAGTSTRALAGWVGLAGPYDFYPIDNDDAKPVFFDPNYPPDSQPIAFARAGSPPTFLGAAKNDSVVNPHRNTEQMAARLRAAGVPVTLELYDRVDHVTLAGAFARPLRWLAPVLDDVAAFIEQTPPSRP
ncbi:MAG: esterase [Rhizobacter sp.]|nr:esterase [Rhizobacter sp.]